ncbi:uncharacterized protein N7459_009360 [Penicillium hispanicum]|uniref:uncharacterized protein n=1 Tax=Penicillium hispanicum TaxID=1080232 RepID=UPI00253FE237|nr:uncharacterized protein N7459_009360 [Penicillium hispanicum]KAJ5569930.1 hypothetical protein N7459_009360 [Penicillium hispanicum]
MESEKSERDELLNKLQMADLGTARRENISTFDDRKNIPSVRLEDIEASRQSNIPGTAAQRLASKNKLKLTAWADFHKTVTDTGGLEDLEDLMRGQSHRANLVAAVQSSGAASVKSTGSRSTISSAPARQDPALDINNDSSSSSRKSRRSSRGHGSKGPATRARRPEPLREDFSRKITSPEQFLAAARKTMGTALTSSGLPATPPSRAFSTAAAGQEKRPPASYRPEITIPVSTPVVTETPTGQPAALAQAVADTPTPSPRLVPLEKTAAFKRPTKPATLTPTPIVKLPGPPEPKAPKIPVGGELLTSEAKNASEIKKPESTELLVDLGAAPEEHKAPDPWKFLMSPGQAQLQGLEFAKEAGEDDLPKEPLADKKVDLPGADQQASAAEAASNPLLQVVGELIESHYEEMSRDLQHRLENEKKRMLDSFVKRFEQTSELAAVSRGASTPVKGLLEQETTPRPSSTGQPVPVTEPPVQDWLKRAIAAAATPVQDRDSFKEYRSPEKTPSSGESAREKSTGGQDHMLSPLKSGGSEFMPPFESLRVSESPKRPTPASSLPMEPKINPLSLSIHAAPWPPYRPGAVKVIGPQPFVPRSALSHVVTEMPASLTTRPSNVPTGLRSVSTSIHAPPRPTQPKTEPSQSREAEEAVSKVRVIGPAPCKPRK